MNTYIFITTNSIKYKCGEKINGRETVPVSLELVIKCQFSSCSDSLGGEEPNSELAIDSPLEWDKNSHQVSQHVIS